MKVRLINIGLVTKVLLSFFKPKAVYSQAYPTVPILPRPQLDPRCGTGIDTAIGCIPLGNSTEFLGFLLRWGLGVGGGVAFLLILYAGFQITTSAGNPQQLQAGKEMLTAAIAGLMLLIFSVFLLELIGVKIFDLPGF
jgi:hypothetical protein